MNELIAYLVSIGYKQTDSPHKRAICYHPPIRTFWEGMPGVLTVVLDDHSEAFFDGKTIRSVPINDLEGPSIKFFRD